MTERRERRHQVHVQLRTTRVQRPDLIRRKRVRPLPNLRSTPERERVLDVQLQVVKLVPGTRLRQPQQSPKRRHLSPRDIMVKPAHRIARPILDLHRRNPVWELLRKLRERLLRIKKPCLPRRAGNTPLRPGHQRVRPFPVPSERGIRYPLRPCRAAVPSGFGHLQSLGRRE